MLQYQVNEMGKKIFALSDDRVRQFCRGKFNFQETCYRPGKTLVLVKKSYKIFFLKWFHHITCDMPPITLKKSLKLRSIFVNIKFFYIFLGNSWYEAGINVVLISITTHSYPSYTIDAPMICGKSWCRRKWDIILEGF